MHKVLEEGQEYKPAVAILEDDMSLSKPRNGDFQQCFRVVVVGAGLVGLVVAALLQQTGYHVTVLERDEKLQTIGAGIQMPANMNRVLDQLGVLQEVVDESEQPPAMRLYSWKGTQLMRLDLDPYTKDKYGVGHLTCHRADLRRILFDKAQKLGVDIQMGMKIDKDKSDLTKGVVAFDNAEQLHADLVVGADGEHSMCREALLGFADPPQATGMVANRIMVDLEKVQEDPALQDLVDEANVHCWMGPDCQVVCYSLKGVFNLVLSHTATDEKLTFGPQPASEQQIRDFFEGWDPQILRLLDHAHTFLKWRQFSMEPIHNWVHESGRLVLVGDAAHASSPHLAQGAAIGMESAAVLARLLATAKSADEVAPLLKRYNAMREPRTTRIIRASKQQEDIYHLHDGPQQAERDRLMLASERSDGFPFKLADPSFQQWLWSYDARAEVDKALQSMACREDR